MAEIDSGAAGGARYKHLVTLVSLALALVVALAALMVTIGWGVDSDSLKTLFAGGQPIWCSTAINFVLIALALLFFSLPHKVPGFAANKKPLYIVATALAGIVFLSGLLTAMETLLGLDLSLNQTLYQSSSETAGITYPGPMSPDASIAFAFIAAGLITQSWLPALSGRMQWLFLVALMITSLPLFGTLTGARALCTFFGCLRMSAVVSMFFLLACLACFLSRSESGPAHILVADWPSCAVGSGIGLLRLL